MLGPSLKVRGGISTIERFLLENWPAERYEVQHIETLEDGTKATKLLIAIRAFIRVIGVMLVYRPDVVHIHFASRASFFRKSAFVLISSAFRRKIVLHANGAEFHLFYEEESGSLQKRYIRYILNKADCLLVVSRQWQEFYSRIYTRRQPVVVPNPVYCPIPCPDRSTTRPIVLTLGRLGHRKGTYDLLKAIPLVLKHQPEAEFWLGGDGDVNRVRDILDRETWGNRVKLLGWVTGRQKEEALIHASVFVLPSYNEGQPLAVLEAMAYGLPVVSTPIGGIPEAITDGETGFLIRPGDVEALVHRITLLLQNRSLRKQMGAKAREKALNQFDVRSVIRRLLGIYDELLKQP